MSASPDIFLSYNREDAEVARRFAEGFEAQGFDVWWDQALRSGEAYDEVTEAALRGAKAVVVLWSPRSVVSRWVRAEASIADENGTLAPVMIEPCNLPVMFRLTQTANLAHWEGAADDNAWRALLGDVQRMVGKDSAHLIRQPDPAPASAFAMDKEQTNLGMPLVAVLPLQSRGGGEQMEFLAEDLTEEITRELGQSFYCKVIATSTMASWRGRSADHQALRRDLGARYLVEGRLQGSSDHVRLTVQLIDTESDSALWSSRFTEELSEIEEAPDQFPVSVAIDLSQMIGKIEIARAAAKSPPYSAWEHALRASNVSGMRGPGSTQRAIGEARSAVSAAPDCGLAYAALAGAIAARLSADRLLLSESEKATLIRETYEAIKRAMELDGHNPHVLTRLASTYGLIGDAETGLRLAHRAAMLAPNSADTQIVVGLANFMMGRTSETIDALSKLDQLGLSDNSNAGGLSVMSICLFIEDRLTEAEEAVDRALMLEPTYYVALRWKAIIAAELGKEQSARATVRLLREAEPGRSIDDYLDSPKNMPVEHPRKYEAIEILRRLLEESEDHA